MLLSDELDYYTLTEAITSYKSLLNSLADVSLEDDESKKDIQFSNGIALGTTWAAMCIDDHIRTKRFIKGTYHAIQDQLKTKKTVHLLYAGTGPYGTLILPLLNKFSPEVLKVTLLEINESSMTSVKGIVEQLHFEAAIVDYLRVDASTHIFEPSLPFDIVLSETMQHALVKEQQIPIFLNIMKQVNAGVTMIPTNIGLDLALVNSSFHASNSERSSSIETIINFNRTCIDAYNADPTSAERSFIDTTITIPEFDSETYNHIAVMTEIQVYGNERVRYYESGLTIPKVLMRSTAEIATGKTTVHLQFDISENPDYTMTLLN